MKKADFHMNLILLFLSSHSNSNLRCALNSSIMRAKAAGVSWGFLSVRSEKKD